MAMAKFPNLKAEMARRDISIQQMAKSLNKSRNTITGKLSGRQPIYLDEAFVLTKEFFPNCDLWYLFATEESEPTTDKTA